MAINNNWKTKIDPVFDKAVRNYVTLLDGIENSPSEGTLNLPDDLIDEFLVDNLGRQDLDEPMDGESLFEFARKVGILDDKGFRLIIDFISSEDCDKVLELSSKMVEGLPEEESRAFYLRELKSLPSHPDKDSIDFLSIPSSIFLRYLFIKLEGDVIEDKEEHIEYFKKSNVMSTLINVRNLTSIHLAHQKTPLQLVEDIRNGNDKSLFKALTVNKSLLFTEEVKNRFIQAQLTGDTEFFKKAGKAIADNPLARIGQHGKTYSVLTLFWYTGLYKLTYPELHSFLETCGLIPPPYPYGFEKFMERHIRPAFPV